jgi:hypothetical protein
MRGYMLTKEQQEELLKSIELEGGIDKKQIHLILGSKQNISHIAGNSTGRLRLHAKVIRDSKLIFDKLESLASLHQSQIRCSLCSQVISYPCWHYTIKYAVNEFHHFICFDETNSLKPSVKCYRKD